MLIKERIGDGRRETALKDEVGIHSELTKGESLQAMGISVKLRVSRGPSISTWDQARLSEDPNSEDSKRQGRLHWAPEK